MRSRTALLAATAAAMMMLTVPSLADDEAHDHDGTSAPPASGSGSGSGSGMGMMKGGMMGGCSMMGGMMGTHAAGRIAFLKAELGITEAQKDAFEAYAAAMRKNLEQMRRRHDEMTKAKDEGSAPERLERRIGSMEGRVAALKEMKEPLAKLYGALSDEQKSKADGLLTGMGCMM